MAEVYYCGALYDSDACVFVDPGNGEPYFYCIGASQVEPPVFPVCCDFSATPVTYSDFGAGGLHCYGQAPSGTCNIPAGTWTVAAGGDTSPWFGTMLVQFSDGQQMFEDANTYNCGDFSEQPPPIANAQVFTFAVPVVATLFFEHDNGQGVPYPTNNAFICYEPA